HRATVVVVARGAVVGGLTVRAHTVRAGLPGGADAPVVAGRAVGRHGDRTGLEVLVAEAGLAVVVGRRAGVGVAYAVGRQAVIVDGAEQVIVARHPVVLGHGDAHGHLADALGAAGGRLAVIARHAVVLGHRRAGLAGDAGADGALAGEDRAVDGRPLEALSGAACAVQRTGVHVVTLGAVVAHRRRAGVGGLIAGADMAGVRRH